VDHKSLHGDALQASTLVSGALAWAEGCPCVDRGSWDRHGLDWDAGWDAWAAVGWADAPGRAEAVGKVGDRAGPVPG